ncbi:uncharacterized protein LOC132636409 isoform X1 [Lycium barbarum]|uniref:uncharacterized protein LOC132636409 isoform X1 n=1 Tax=Lycium barbarum TaxID=112863 RepID=UPI00293ED2C7|nr:uncharacterized protein LOC132636409 isoform X1 [Lycium barbarum]
MESASFVAGTNRSGNYKTKFSPNNQHHSSSNSRLFCDFCKRPGHIMDRCYKLHGYPPNNNNTQGNSNHPNQSYNGPHNSSNNPIPNRSFNQNSNYNRNLNIHSPNRNYNYNNNSWCNQNQRYNRGNNNRTVANVHCLSDNMSMKRSKEDHRPEELYNLSLTKGQLSYVKQVLQKFNNSGENSQLYDIPGGTGSFASTIFCTFSIDFGKLSCECFKNKFDLWILESGASNNMTFNRSLLDKITTLPHPILFVLPNGHKVKVTQIGSVVLGP